MTMDPLADFDREILEFLQAAGIAPDQTQIETPQRPEFGERSTNAAMKMAREWRRPPNQIAIDIAAGFDRTRFRFIEAVEPAGGFINFRVDYTVFTPHVICAVRDARDTYGRHDADSTRRVVVEHTSVNPNKEWHIGHVRNAVLGDVIVRLLRRVGYAVEVQNYIDDTGPQAAQSVLGLRDFPEAPRPEEKFDHFAGRHYVKLAAELAAEAPLRQRLTEMESGGDAASEQERSSVTARLENIERLKKRIFNVMRELESGEHRDVTEDILNAQLETAYRLGVYYNLLNWESHLVQSKIFDEAMERIKESPRVYRPKDGRYANALVIQTDDAGTPDEEPKAEVLIRSNGLPTYVGKDIAYHMWKFHLLPNRLGYMEYTQQPDGEILFSTALDGRDREEQAPHTVINVIDVRQSLPQAAVKEALRVAGFEEAAGDLLHLAYGFVSTREGKISGRKGTNVSGDAVIDEAVRVALERVREKRSQDLSEADMQDISEAVGVGAIRYFMVQYNPLREIVFDVSDVVSYDGNTGLYIQYALVRMHAILRRARAEQSVQEGAVDEADTNLLEHEQEKKLVFHLAKFPDLLATAGRTLAVNLVAEYAFDLATIFNQFYRDCGVLNAEPRLRASRLLLVRTVRDVLTQACDVLGVPVIERL